MKKEYSLLLLQKIRCRDCKYQKDKRRKSLNKNRSIIKSDTWLLQYKV